MHPTCSTPRPEKSCSTGPHSASAALKESRLFVAWFGMTRLLVSLVGCLEMMWGMGSSSWPGPRSPLRVTIPINQCCLKIPRDKL